MMEKLRRSWLSETLISESIILSKILNLVTCYKMVFLELKGLNICPVCGRSFFKFFFLPCCGTDWWRPDGVAVSESDFDQAIGRSEGQCFEARLIASLLCCFLRQAILSLHQGA